MEADGGDDERGQDRPGVLDPASLQLQPDGSRSPAPAVPLPGLHAGRRTPVPALLRPALSTPGWLLTPLRPTLTPPSFLFALLWRRLPTPGVLLARIRPSLSTSGILHACLCPGFPSPGVLLTLVRPSRCLAEEKETRHQAHQNDDGRLLPRSQG